MKQLILSEIKLWATKLSHPTLRYSSMPTCPYAMRALERHDVEVRMDFGWQYSEVVSTAKHFPRGKSLVIHAQLNPVKRAGDMHADIRKLNMKLSKHNIWLIGFHPDDPEDDFGQYGEDFEPLVDEPYAMIFVQRLTELDDASRVLEAKRYYKRASPDELAELYRRRQAREEYEDGNGKKTRSAGTWRKSQSI